jgi:DnaJ family protein A protein 2
MRHDEKVVFRNKADEKPNMEAGNLNFIIQEKQHETFKRKGADLLITKTLSSKEALCGFEWKILHLDKREVIVKSKPGEGIKAEADHARPFVKCSWRRNALPRKPICEGRFVRSLPSRVPR